MMLSLGLFVGWRFRMQLTAHEASIAQIVRCMNASRRARISQREHSGKPADRHTRVASVAESAKLSPEQ
jgi:hypothetical protein